MENNISNADVIATAGSYISVANTAMVIAGVVVAGVTLLVAIAGIIFTYWQNRKNKEIVDKAIDKVLTKIADNEKMRNDLIDKIIKNENFETTLQKIVNLYINERSNTAAENKQEQSNIGGLE